jgi:hypothetical protein
MVLRKLNRDSFVGANKVPHRAGSPIEDDEI